MSTFDPGGPHFEWKSYLALLDKARRDLAALRDTPSSDALFNFLATANHIYDWIKNDPSVARPALVRDARAMVIDDSARAPHIVRDLCNGAKHFEKRSRPDTQVSVIRLAAGAPWPTKLVLEVEVQGAMRDVLDVGAEAIADWEVLMHKHGLPTKQGP
jgi:hypothetical protein